MQYKNVGGTKACSIKEMNGASINNLEAGLDGRVTAVKLVYGSKIEADTVVIGIGAKPAIGPFETLSMNNSIGGIQADKSSSSNHRLMACSRQVPLDFFCYWRCCSLPVEDTIISRISTQEYTSMKAAQEKFGGSFMGIIYLNHIDSYCPVGETVEVGNFNPKIATFRIDFGRLKGVLVESGSPEVRDTPSFNQSIRIWTIAIASWVLFMYMHKRYTEFNTSLHCCVSLLLTHEFQLLPKLARSQPIVDKAKLASASSVEEALQIAEAALHS
ncbi:unnamed protein product [Brassica oleracea]|uniref:FAD/NAD(P)-binding domain-containing protein n=1 Tax=Brassica oleracea TaxID=3712 RepID=A0A3P6CNI0_BRAOL|nr:unnamed protein product [Brassica oleracea]